MQTVRVPYKHANSVDEGDKLILIINFYNSKVCKMINLNLVYQKSIINLHFFYAAPY